MTKTCLVSIVTLLGLTAGLSAQTTPAIDNEYVRVFTATEQPGRKSQPHSHATGRVMIYMEPAHQQYTTADGKVQDIVMKQYGVRFDPPVKQHVSENVGKEVFHIVEVELKKADTQKVVWPKLDPIAVDGAHYKVVLDNPQVRVIHGVYGVGDKGPLHQHDRKRVTVFLNGMDAKLTLGDGSSSIARRKPGEIVWSDTPATHQEENVGKPYEVIIVDLKQ